MALLQGGTVFRRFPSLSDPGSSNDGPGGGDPPSREVAPIEDITQETKGLSTTITFTFKAVKGERAQSRLRTGYTILCAEDNLVNQRVLSKMLGKFGQDHVMTQNGQMAVETYTANPDRFPCIFMDLAMPVMDGREATVRIRAFESGRPGHRRALIVGMVAFYGLPSNMSALSAAGFDLLMHKPYRMNELYQLFMDGPQTNVAALYGSLTDKEKSAYPLPKVKDAVLKSDARSNAIRDALKRLVEPTWDADGRGIAVAFTKIIVNVVKAGEDEQA